MSNSADIRLIVPQELGSAILADQQLQQLIQDTSGVTVETHTDSGSAAEEFRDPVTVLIAIAATPAAVAAVKGLFELFKVIVKEAYETRRKRMEHEHEYKKLQLELGQRSIDLPLDQDQEVVFSILEREEYIILEQMGNA